VNSMQRTHAPLLFALGLIFPLLGCLRANDLWVVYEGGDGPGKGKHIVLVSGDDEYRSEEALPQLGKILAVRHGFKCTVLFPIDPETGAITPDHQTNIPGLESLDDADMMVISLRFRELPDSQMKHFVDYTNSGKPILGLRTSTHAFNYTRNKKSPYAKYDFRSKEWPGGFGQQVLGDTWIDHHGHHKREAARGLVNGLYQEHPILRGVEDVFGETDVYGVKNLGPDAQILLWGQVLLGMKPDDGAKFTKSIMPLFWTKGFTGTSGKTARIICTTMGASIDLKSEGLRRALVNSCYWGLAMEDQIEEEANVDIVGKFEPTFYGFGTFKKGVKPLQHKL